jgi:hypothetical protein
MLVPFGQVVPLMALCTTRDVAAGDELLIPYGHSFWQECADQGERGRASPEPTTGRTRSSYSVADVRAKVRMDALRMAEASLAVQSTYESELRELGALLAMLPDKT